jgi:hypothetical protein
MRYPQIPQNPQTTNEIFSKSPNKAAAARHLDTAGKGVIPSFPNHLQWISPISTHSAASHPVTIADLLERVLKVFGDGIRTG